MLSASAPTKDNPLVDEDQEPPLFYGGLEALAQILGLDLPLDLRSGFAGALQLLYTLTWLRRLCMWLFAIIFLERKLRFGCRTRLRLFDRLGHSLFLAIGADVPRAISIKNGKLQKH